MRLHIDILGWLHFLWGGFGLLTGLSLLVLAAGAQRAMPVAAPGLGEQAALGLLVSVAGLLVAGGLLNVAGGWGVRLGRPRARLLVLALVFPNLLLAPLGTALGAYTIWVLLGDDARRAFHRAPRAV